MSNAALNLPARPAPGRWRACRVVTDCETAKRKPAAPNRRGRRRWASLAPRVDPRVELELIWRMGLRARIAEGLPGPDPLGAFDETDVARVDAAVAAMAATGEPPQWASQLAPSQAFRAKLSPRHLRQHFIRWLRRQAHCCVSCGAALNRRSRELLGLGLAEVGAAVSIISVSEMVPALRVGDVIEGVTGYHPHPFRPHLETRRTRVRSVRDIARVAWDAGPHGPLVLHVRRQRRAFDVTVVLPKNCSSCREVDASYRKSVREAPPALYVDEKGRPLHLRGTPRMLPVAGPRYDGESSAWPACANLSDCQKELIRACGAKDAPGMSCPAACAAHRASP